MVKQKKLIARWETRGKKHWYELYQELLFNKNNTPAASYFYRGDYCGGNIGFITKEDAIEIMQNKVSSLAETSNPPINMRMVFWTV